ncbi:SAP30-binding protein isoform X2 [Rhodamnia argentea]|uniref:SAP30-binding protein isoform X2 n=1 Tax=Rhodamnia argentea TaxID=178133 RepID=A0ABM3H5M6_9MYRT|nr:SAP30-binding protein isoform X2 [Rhodamnia argentea]
MAAKKKESEGIMLLSVYNDEDDEMEDAEDDNAEQRQRPEPGEVAEEERRSERVEDDPREASDREDGARVGSERMAASDSGHESTPQLTAESPTPIQRVQPPQEEVAVSVEVRRRNEMLCIVDYGHDEVVMSPEAEEGEIDSSGHFMLDERLQTENGDYQEKPTQETVQVVSPNNQDISLLSGHIEPSQSDLRNATEAQPIEGEDSTKVSDGIDPLDKFLSSPPTDECSEELQERVRKFIAYKRAGKSFNAEVRNKKDYRNPDFLLHSVRYQDIDQIGSCFRKEVFDPHGYDQSDYYDVLEVDMKREVERKEQERKKSQQVEFVSSGVQAGAPAILPKVNVPVAGVPTAASGGLRSSDLAARDGRQNKKSKWDKVDGDRKNPLPSGAQESVSTVAAHAAILSAANAGAANRDEERQKREDLARGSWIEDPDVEINYRNIRLTFVYFRNKKIRSNPARQRATQIRYPQFFFLPN